MSKKALQWIMIVCVCLIWGTIIYRVISGNSGGDGALIVAPKSVGEKRNTTVHADRYELIADYRDPFASKLPAVRRMSTGAAPKTSRPSSKQKEKVSEPQVITYSWPSINYKGMIRRTESGQLLGMVSIAGKETIVRMNDAVSDLKVTDISSTAITLTNPSGESRSFNK